MFYTVSLKGFNQASDSLRDSLIASLWLPLTSVELRLIDLTTAGGGILSGDRADGIGSKGRIVSRFKVLFW